MAFEQFSSSFEVTRRDPKDGGIDIHWVDEEFLATVEQLVVEAYERGLYTVLSSAEVDPSTEAVLRAFPELTGRIAVFGRDWLGRHCAVDRRRQLEGRPLVLLIDPGGGECLQVPVPILEFHDDELVRFRDDALASSFFDAWTSASEESLQPGECAGDGVPLFLGGEDVVENLEIFDLDVYVELCGQLRQGVRALPDGTRIGEIEMS